MDEHGPFVGDSPLQTVFFHSYVELPEGEAVGSKPNFRISKHIENIYIELYCTLSIKGTNTTIHSFIGQV